MSKRCVLKLIKPCHGPRCHFTGQMWRPKWPFRWRRWHKTLRFELWCSLPCFWVRLSFSVTIFNLLPKKSLKKISIGSGRYLVTQWVSILNDPPVSDCFSSRIFHWLVLQYSSFTYSWRDIFLACSPLISSNFFINFSIVAMEA